MVINNSYWLERWASGETGFNQTEANQQLTEYYHKLQLKNNDRILVPLCGKSIDLLWLAQQGHPVLGIELSPIACQNFFDENHLTVENEQLDNFTAYKGKQITLFSGDFFAARQAMLGNIAAVYDRGSLIALPAETRKNYAKHLSQLLNPSSKILLIVITYDQNTMDGPPFSVDENEVNSLFQNDFSITKVLDQAKAPINPHLQQRGLTQASEQVYILEKR